ncbi:MAG: hypothetical protein PVH87_27120, partial [Desulfobacteraceae bacterium]
MKQVETASWLIWGVLLASMAVLFWMILTYPFGETSHDMEALLSQRAIPFAVILGNVYLFIAYFRRREADIVRCVIMVIAFGAVCMASSERSDQVRQLTWEFNGSVVRKYRSNNHGAKTLEIKGLGGGDYEFVEDSFWAAAQPGDRISKERYSPYAMLNGEKKAIVQKRLIGTAKGRQLK